MIIIEQVNFFGSTGFEIVFSDGGYARVEKVIDNTFGVLKKEVPLLLNSTLLSFEHFSEGGFRIEYKTIEGEERFLQLEETKDKEIEETKELLDEWRKIKNGVRT